MPPTPLTRRDWLLALVVSGATAAVYAPAYRCDFVNWDDGVYVAQNPHVLGGLSADGLLWALTTDNGGFWIPLTWLSFQIDATFWGANPAGYHLTNLLLHAANAALVYLGLVALTGARGRSLTVAALWALHPLRVESVAWVTERKDVLCGFFWLLTTAAYLRYVRCPSGTRFLPVVLGFAAALMVKPMAVTFPCALLLLDAWPLGRLRSTADLPRLLREKAALFLLVAVSSCLTLYTQAAGGAIRSGQELPPGARAANVVLSYATYLRQTFWPADLAAFYPLQVGPPPVLRAIGAVGLLLLVTGLALALRLRAPYLMVGWLWFLGTLVPVIGIFHAGMQAHADRFTYLPHLGLLVAVVWGTAELWRRVHLPRVVLSSVAVLALGLSASLTWKQLEHWRNGRALWERVIEVTPECAFAWHCLGYYHLVQGDLVLSLQCAEKALSLNPGLLDAELLRARVLLLQGRWGLGAEIKAIRATPPDVR